MAPGVAIKRTPGAPGRFAERDTDDLIDNQGCGEGVLPGMMRGGCLGQQWRVTACMADQRIVIDETPLAETMVAGERRVTKQRADAEMIAEAQIDNGSVDGYTDFQGAAPLNSGPNAMVINPTGSGMTSDLLAQVLRLVAQSPVLSGVPQANMVGLAQQVIAGTSGTQGTQTQVDAFNSLLERVNSPTFVSLRGSVDGRSLEAWRAGNLLWTKPLANWFQAAQLNGASPAGLTFSQVIRHGLAGYGYVKLGHDSGNLSVMIRIDIVNQSLKAFCAVPGTVGPAIVLVDDSVVVGGWHATERCPYALRWGGQNDGAARLGNATDTGLMWTRYFASEAPSAGGEPAAVESLTYDGQRIFTAQVRNGSSRLLRTYRLNSGDGTGTTTQTTIHLAA